MSACLYCREDAGELGYHPACVPQRPVAEEAPTPLEETRTLPRPAAYAATVNARIVDFDMPFGSMILFMVKWALASIPAILLLAAIGVFVSQLIVEAVKRGGG